MMFMPTGIGKTTTNSLTIDRPLAGVTNTNITIAFSTTHGISPGDIIRVFFPTGLFISTPQLETLLKTRFMWSLLKILALME
jgi:hypothetical protein